jgi:hypothetical protein
MFYPIRFNGTQPYFLEQLTDTQGCGNVKLHVQGFFPDINLQDLPGPEYNKVDGTMRENRKQVHRTVTRTHETKQTTTQQAIHGGRPISKALSDACYLHPCYPSRYPSDFEAASIRIEPRSLGPQKKWMDPSVRAAAFPN